MLAQGTVDGPIARYAASVGYYSADTLAEALTAPYQADSEKVASIYYWMVQHISYDVAEFHDVNKGSRMYFVDSTDSVQAMGDYYTSYATNVLRKKMGVCEGYATLFKLLCDKAKITCELVHGYAKTGIGAIGKPFEENHAWNAVKLNDEWKLLDACWGSGHCDEGVTKFTREINSYYFLTPPGQFIHNHYPTESKWALMADTLALKDYISLPELFLGQKNAVIIDVAPRNGFLAPHIGDKLVFELELDHADSSDVYHGTQVVEFDQAGKIIPCPTPQLLRQQSFRNEGNKIYYTYKVASKKVKGLYLEYKGAYLAAYKVAVK